MRLELRAASYGRDMFVRCRCATPQPSITHDMQGGKWVRYGASVPGPQPQGIYEDRLVDVV